MASPWHKSTYTITLTPTSPSTITRDALQLRGSGYPFSRIQNKSMAKRMSSIYRLPAVLLLLLIWIGDSNSLIADGLWGQPLKISTPSRPYVLHETSWPRKLAVHRTAASTCRALSPPTSMRETLAESAAPVIEESSKGGISSRKSVVVARGKARLFWCVYWLCLRKGENRLILLYNCCYFRPWWRNLFCIPK